MSRSILVGLTVLAGLAVASAPAAAELPPPPAAGYESPLRAECETELDKDVKWRARLTAVLTDDKAYEFQNTQARIFAKDQKHVYWAYAGIWLLTVGFVVDLMRRQRRLHDQIGRLEREIERAASERES